jgi:uncharacterized repeat protein (TIGR01451 family)/CSLREA domain-containing protein
MTIGVPAHQGKCMLELGGVAITARAPRNRPGVWALVLFLLAAAVPTQDLLAQATCTWNLNAPGQWDNPANWSGCAGGNGSPLGTPGPADHAIIGPASFATTVDLAGVARTVDQLSLAAGSIAGAADLTVSTQFNWTGGIFEGGLPATTNIIVAVGATAFLSNGPHGLFDRNFRNLGTVFWGSGDISLNGAAEFENSGVLTINATGPIGSPLRLLSDGTPTARLHNVAIAGSRIEKQGFGTAEFANNLQFDNGSDVILIDGILRIDGPGGDFGSYQIGSTAALEFGPDPGITRDLTGSPGLSGSGRLRKSGQGQVTISGGYALTGPVEVVDGRLFLNTMAPVSFVNLRVDAPGVLDGNDDFVVSNILTWNGGEITGSTSPLSLTVQPGATVTVNLDGVRPSAYLSSRQLINQGTVLVSATGPVPTHFWLSIGADIDNQGQFELRNNSAANLQLDCDISDCAGFYNRASGTVTLNDLNGIVLIQSNLLEFNNDGLVTLLTGCASISPAGVDTGTYRYAGSCTLAFFTPIGSERVFESSVLLDQQGSTNLQLEGSLRLNGATRTLGNVVLNPSGILHGPAAITVDGTLLWRGTIEGIDISETITIGAAGSLQTTNDPGDTPTLRSRKLINLGSLDILAARVLFEADPEISNFANMSLSAMPGRSASIGCALPPTCGLLLNNPSATITSIGDPMGPANGIDPDVVFDNQGTLDLAIGTLDLEAAYTAQPGSLVQVADGANLRRTGTPLILADGILAGLGSIQADVDAQAVSIQPGPGTGALTIAGNFTAGPSTLLSMEIAGVLPPPLANPDGAPRALQAAGDFDQLRVTGTATLDGTLDVIDLGYTPSGIDQFDLIVYANHNGNVALGLNPYSGFALDTGATRARLTQSVLAPCEWDPLGGGPANWSNPARWLNCTSGSGPVLGTPGASDRAVIAAGNVNLDVAITVAALELVGGSISGASNLDIVNEWIWTGGSVAGPGASLVTLGSGAIGQFAGGHKTLDGRTLQMDGNVVWTTGLIELANAAQLVIAPVAVLTSNPGVAPESFAESGVGTPNLINNGTMVKTGSNTVAIGPGVNYQGSGNIDVLGGHFLVAAASSGTFDGNYTADAGGVLEFVASSRTFSVTSTFSGTGLVIFGDLGPSPVINAINGCFDTTIGVEILNADVAINCAAPTNLSKLRLGHPGAVLQGSSVLAVTNQFEWAHGSIKGVVAGQTFELSSGAVAAFTAPLGTAAGRFLSNRQFINHGTVNWVAGNPTTLELGGEFSNEADGTISISMPPGNNADWLSDLSPGARLNNLGLIDVLNVQANRIGAVFDNAGTLRITAGVTTVQRNGTDTGTYDIGPLGQIVFDGPAITRTLQSGSSMTGGGTLVVNNMASLLVNSSVFAIDQIVTVAGGYLQLDAPSPIVASNWAIDTATLTGNAELRVAAAMVWDGGTLGGSGASPGPLVVQPGATFTLASPAPRLLDGRDLSIEGNAVWQDGDIRVPTAATGRLQVAAGGTLDLATVGTIYFGCDIAPCVAEMDVLGTLNQIAGTSDFSSTSPLTLGGALNVIDGSLQTAGVIQTAGTLDVAPLGSIQAPTIVVNGGVVSGVGTIGADLDNQGGIIRPGNSPGQLSIFGAFTQAAGGTLDIEIGGTTPGVDADFLFVSGLATLGGTLNILDVGFTPTPPQEYIFLNSDTAVSGSFASTNIPYAGYGVRYDALDGVLAPVAGPLLVNSVADPGTGGCDVAECTLREAIDQANLIAGADTISFAIPPGACTGPGGACVITPSSPLPAITTAIRIDGYSQTGASANTLAPSLGLGTDAVLMVEIDGSLTSAASGITINAPSAMVSVEGLAIHGFSSGIVILGPGDANYSITGNFLGLHADGSPANDQFVGVSIQGGSVQLGNSTASGMNVISGNQQQGVSIGNIPLLAAAVIRGNLIGTTPSGMAPLPNGLQGIIASTGSQIQGILIGGNQPDDRNVISGNTQDGIRFDCFASVSNCFDGARVFGNFIGPAADGSPLGNIGSGVNLASMDGGRVDIGGSLPGQGNLIASNGGNGIQATFGGLGRAAFRGNAIFGNALLAIDLGADGPTANDPGDVDTGTNGLQNYPDFISYTLDPGGAGAALVWSIETLDDGSNYPMTVDFYRAVGNQFDLWLGSANCAAAAPSTCSANLVFPGGTLLTPADAIVGIVTDNQGRSSEAGLNLTLIVDPVVNSDLDPGDGVCDLAECTLREAVFFAAPGSNISFDPVFFAVPRTITLSVGEIVPTQDVNINGPGAALLNISGNNSSRVMDVSGINLSVSGATLTGGNGQGFIPDAGGAIRQQGGSLMLTDMVLAGNSCTGTGPGGALSAAFATVGLTRTEITGNTCINAGGVYIQDGDLTINDSSLTGNSGTEGEALRVNASSVDTTATLSNVTISNNSTIMGNSAIRSEPLGGRTVTMTLTNVTVSGNTTTNVGSNGALWARPSGGTHVIVLHNTIVAGNLVAGSANDVDGSPDVSSSFNVIGVGGSLVNGVNGNQTGITNPLLAPLGNYGGTTLTRALLPGSPAIDAGTNGLGSPTDQRGVARPQLANTDVGAFESQGFVLSLLSGSPQSAALNTLFAAPLVVGVVANDPLEPVDGGAVDYQAPQAGASAALASTPATISGGQASVSATANNTPGPYLVDATALGAGATASFALNNAAAATVTAIATITPNVTVVGQPYNVDATVTLAGVPVAIGTVQIVQLSDNASCSYDLAVGGGCSLVANSALTTAVRAYYLGSVGLSPSSSAALTHVVDRAQTAIAISSDSPDPSAVGMPITVRVTLDVVAPGAGTPLGEILVTDGSASCGITLPALSCTFVPKALGVATLEARYLGDADFDPSIDTESHTVSADGADLSIIKRNGLRLVPGGVPSTYVILVSNAGPQDVINARVTDLLPAQFSNAAWTCTATGGAVCPASGSGTVDALVGLPAGSSLSFALTATAQSTPEQIVTNRAIVEPPLSAPDPFLDNNESIDVDPIGVFGEGFETENE